MQVEAKTRIFGLDVLRCLAIVLVLFSHTSFLLPFSEKHKHFVLLYFGFMGVEIFFVLSGYLVGKIAIELFTTYSISLRTIKYFLLRRWFRTLPAYYIALLLYALLYYFSDHQFIFSDTHYLLYLVFLQNFFTLHPNFFVLAWSLSVEEWFYFLLPFCFFVFSWFITIRKKMILSVIISLICIVMLIRVFVVFNTNPDWDAGVRRIVPLRLDSLMIGVFMAYAHSYFKKLWGKYAKGFLLFGFLVLIFSSLWLYFKVINDNVSGDFFSKTFLFSFFSSGIALCLPYVSNMKKCRYSLIRKIITHISVISYSLYLLHILVAFLVITACNKLFSHNSSIILFLLIWLCCIISATIMNRICEQPFMKLRERFKL